jgi:non-specific serine/threonine protein kinase
MGPEDSIYEAQQAFTKSIEKNRPRLFAVLVTDNGKSSGKPIGIVTPWDLTPGEAPAEDYVFRKQEDFWNIVFEGKAILMRNTIGLQYIAYLLQKPSVEFRVSTLQSAARGTHVDSTAIIYDRMNTEQLEQYGLSISHGLGDAGVILDPRSISEYKKYHQRLVEELERAKGHGDPEQVALLKEQIDMISAQLKAARGLRGKARKSKDDTEKVRKAVTNRIRDSLKKIQKEHRSLGLHLSKSIKTGIRCSYTPEKPIPWKF